MRLAAPRWLAAVEATRAEIDGPLLGDDVVPEPDVVMDRAFTLAATPEQTWPWLVQLGKQRAGWYLPVASSASSRGAGVPRIPSRTVGRI